MSLRYSAAFKLPRKIFKTVLVFLYPLVVRIWTMPKVLSIEETIRLLIGKRMSLARFGDGEFLYLIDKIDLPFQRYDEALAFTLRELLNSDVPELLIGLPSGYHGMDTLNREGRVFWKSQIAWVYPRLRKYLYQDKIYANASMTRLYFEIEDKSLSTFYFGLVRRIWENRDILLIEGTKSRLGVGNDLFKNARSLERILAPAHHAYDKKDQIISSACRYAKKGQLILVALGPTAKAVVLELHRHGYQVIDIGNIDIEYEWFLKGVREKVKVPGKYTSEAVGGRDVQDIQDDLYAKQILVDVSGLDQRP